MASVTEGFTIYGATGYTGRLIAEAAVARGLSPRLCGRDKSRVDALARRLRQEGCVAELDEPGALRHALRDCRVLLNAAGPFSHTTSAWLDACIDRGVHYLDVSGEVEAISRVAAEHARARARGVMLMPAVGFEVVASDCLSLHAFRRLPNARKLRVGYAGLGPPSRGSARTIVQESHLPIRIRRNGQLRSVAPGKLRHAFDFGAGPSPALAVSWGDSVTAHYTTGIGDIESYSEATPAMRMALAMQPYAALTWGRAVDELLALQITKLPHEAVAPVVVAELENAAGERVSSRLSTPDVYDVTAASSLAAVERALAGDVEAGFQTPARVYGADFVLGVPGVTRMDL